MSRHIHKPNHHKIVYGKVTRSICVICGCKLVKSPQGNWESVTVIKFDKSNKK